jgi:hypothetical protein
MKTAFSQSVVNFIDFVLILILYYFQQYFSFCYFHFAKYAIYLHINIQLH